MRNKTEKMLIDDLGRLVPPLSPELEDAPLPSRGRADRVSRVPRVLAAVAAAICVMTAAAVPAVSYAVQKPADCSVITVDINPSLRLTADGGNIVTGVFSADEDGDIILADGDFVSSLIGTDAAQAVAMLTRRAFYTGYITDGSVISIKTANDSAARSQKLALTLSEAAGEFLRSEGVYAAALAKPCSPAALARELGFDADGGRALAGLVGALPTLVLDSEISGTDEASVAESYAEAFADFAASATASLYELLCGKQSALSEIDSLNEQIKSHPDNPELLFKDYWSVRDSGSVSEELCGTIAEMESALERYRAAYGQSIDNAAELSILWDHWYKLLDTEKLYSECMALIDEFGSLASQLGSMFDTLAGALADRLCALAAGDSGLSDTIARTMDSLVSLPVTAAEYARKAYDMLKGKAAMRVSVAAAYCSQAREEINSEDYISYLISVAEKI